MRSLTCLSLHVAFVVLVVCAAGSSKVSAKDTFPIQGRLFIANTYVNPAELNQSMSADGLKTFERTMQLGVEITYPLLRYLDVGMRYTRRSTTQDELTSDAATTYHGTLAQDSILLLARVPFVRTSLLKFDIYGGVGGSNTSLEMQSAAQNGTLTHKAQDGPFTTPHMSFGASGGIGFKQFYLYIEGGYEINKVTNLTSAGTLSGGINTLDLSGRYFMIGLLFDGISGYKK